MPEPDGYKRIGIPEDTYERAKAEKDRRGETWGELVDRAIDSEPVGEFTEQEIRRIVRDEIESYTR